MFKTIQNGCLYLIKKTCFFGNPARYGFILSSFISESTSTSAFASNVADILLKRGRCKPLHFSKLRILLVLLGITENLFLPKGSPKHLLVKFNQEPIRNIVY